MAWKVIVFESKRGEKFVEEFVKSLSPDTVAKIVHGVDLLEKYGPFVGMPHSKKLGKYIYELRIRGKEEIRIIYVFVRNKIYLLHGFKKKQQKVPRKEIETELNLLKSLTNT